MRVAASGWHTAVLMVIQAELCLPALTVQGLTGNLLWDPGTWRLHSCQEVIMRGLAHFSASIMQFFVVKLILSPNVSPQKFKRDQAQGDCRGTGTFTMGGSQFSPEPG